MNSLHVPAAICAYLPQLTKQLTPWSRVIPDKPAVPQLIKKSSAFHGS